MTTINELLQNVDEDQDLVDKWYEVSDEVGKYIAAGDISRRKLSRMQKSSLTELCMDFITNCTPEIEQLIGSDCIEGLDEYVDEDARDPNTGELDSDLQGAISVNFDICAEAIGKEIHGSRYEEWETRSYEESDPAEGRFGQLGAKKRFASWRDKLVE